MIFGKFWFDDMKKIFMYASTALHNAHVHMRMNPPDGFEYEYEEFLAAPTSKNKPIRSFLESIRWTVSPYYNHLKVLLGTPKVRSFSTSCDVIHSTQSLLDPNVPYVCDFEHAAVFSGYNQFALSHERFVKNLKTILESQKLKKLLAWSDAAKASLLNFVDSPIIREKVQTVYPVITPPEKLEKKDDSVIRFLFIGGNFYEKGGIETLMAFDQISEKYDTELTLISTVPAPVHERFSKNKRIKISPRVPYEEVKKLYHQSHVFVMPTHMDTFGFVIPEALSYGLPVIAEDSFSRPEIISHEKSGWLVKSYYSCFGAKGEYIYPTNGELYRKRKEATINPPEWYVTELARAIEKFIVDSKLRNECAKNARKECTEGKFSPKIWKETMNQVYGDAII